MVELRHLRSLVTLAREGSFTRAARRLGIAQPALSQQIRTLERELGVLLVARTNRTSGLTDAGARLVSRAEPILLAVQDATQEMLTHAGVQGGTVRIGCALQTLVEGRLPGLLASFMERHPRHPHRLSRGPHPAGPRPPEAWRGGPRPHPSRPGGNDPRGDAFGRPDHRPGAPLHRAARAHRRAGAPAGRAQRWWSWTISVRRPSSPSAPERRSARCSASPPGGLASLPGLASPPRTWEPSVPSSRRGWGSPSSRAARWMCQARRSRRSPSASPRMERVVTLARNTARYEAPAVKENPAAALRGPPNRGSSRLRRALTVRYWCEEGSRGTTGSASGTGRAA